MAQEDAPTDMTRPQDMPDSPAKRCGNRSGTRFFDIAQVGGQVTGDFLQPLENFLVAELFNNTGESKERVDLTGQYMVIQGQRSGGYYFVSVECAPHDLRCKSLIEGV